MDVLLSIDNLVIPNGKTHESTSWQLSIFPDFAHSSFQGKYSLVDQINLTSITLHVDNVRDNTIYYRYNIHYSDGTASGWSDTIKRAADINLAIPERILMETPVITAKYDYSKVNTGEFVITIPALSFYSGSGDHKETYWKISDQHGVVLHEEMSSTSLTELRIPISILEDGKSYALEARYVDYNNNLSATGLTIYETKISNGVYYVMTSGSIVLQETQKAYVGLEPRTTCFKSFDVRLETTSGTVLAELTDQTTITPYIVVPEKTYNVPCSVYVRMNFSDGRDPINYKIVYTGSVEPFNIINIDKTMSFLSKYDYSGTVTLNGITSQSVYQLPDESIILGKANSNKLYRYEYENNTLVEKGILYDFGVNAHIVIQYLSIIPLYNGNFLVNYGGNTGMAGDQKSVFLEMNYNSGSKTLTKVQEWSYDDLWLSSGVSASAVSTYGNYVYFIPGMCVDSHGIQDLLTLRRFDLTDGSMRNIALPFTAYGHVNMIPLTPTKFIVLGGTLTSIVVNGYKAWERTNNDIYIYDVDTEQFSKVGMLPNTISKDIYNFQGYLRRDGKVVLFNATRTGYKQGDQTSYVIDTETYETVLENNDLNNDVLPYRTTIIMKNGDFVRISANTKDPQRVYNYIGNSKKVTDLVFKDDTITPINNLTVSDSETIEVEDLEIYDTVSITGTGSIRWQDGDIVRVFTAETLVVTRDTTMTREEYNAKGYLEYFVLTGVTLSLV